MPISTTSSLTGYPAVWLTSADRRLEKQFTAVERTGYLTVTDLIRDFLTDAVTGEGAMKIANVTITETFRANATALATDRDKFVQNDVPFPPTQRIRKIVNGGAGYAVGDELYYNVDHARANVLIKVTKVNTESANEVQEFEVYNSGHYNLDPVSGSKRFNFRTRKNEYVTPVLQKDVSYDLQEAGGWPFHFQGRHTGNGWVGGSPGPTKVPAWPGITENYENGATPANPHKWETMFGEDGGGGSANRKTTKAASVPISADDWVSAYSSPFAANETRWPTTGLWANVRVENNSYIVVGAEILLNKQTANVSSNIPPGTIITSVGAIEVIDELYKAYDNGANPATEYYAERTHNYVYFTVNNPVTVDRYDEFYVRGNGLVISDNTTLNNTAEYFKVITESQARIDPHAENKEAVIGKVTAINGNTATISGLYHAITTWYPVVFEGHEIENNATAVFLGTVSNVANITIKPNYGGSANIVTDTPLPGGILNANVKFKFSSSQQWRMAFEALGPQTMNVYAATAVQLRDDGNIAKVTDYVGLVTDLSGIIGDVPSIPTMSKLSSDKVENINIEITGGSTGSGNAYMKVTTALGSWPASGTKIQPGWIVDWNVSGIVIPKDLSVLKQVEPLVTNEDYGKTGRYQLANLLTSTSMVSVTNANIAKVINRTLDPTDITQGFVNRTLRVADHPQSYPLSYFASFTNRGLFFGVWEGTWSVMQKTRARQISERDAWFNWVLIQRPVNRKTGFVRTSGQSPVFCINSVGYKYWKFVVRERDVMHPTQGDKDVQAYYYNDQSDKIELRKTPYRVPADAHTDDSHAIINATNQIALTEDSKYLVSFLYNLTTPRFRYSDELDMIGQTAGDVSMASSDVTITAYGEATRRVYKSLAANLPYNAGLRICVIKDIYTS